MLIKCKYLDLKKCNNRDEFKQCHALASCEFRNRKCPFYITIEKAKKDLELCAERVGMKPDEYLRELYRTDVLERYERG